MQHKMQVEGGGRIQKIFPLNEFAVNIFVWVMALIKDF